MEPTNTSKKNATASWWKPGLAWGLFMFVTMSVVYPYFAGDSITLLSLLLGVLIWSIAGFVFGYSMKCFFNTTTKKENKYSR